MPYRTNRLILILLISAVLWPSLVGSTHARTYYTDGAVHNLATMTSDALGINNGTTLNIGDGVVVTLERKATYSTTYVGVGNGEAFLNLSGSGQLLFAQEMAITTSDSEPTGTITMTGTSYMNPATYYGGMRGNGTFNITDDATLEIRTDGELYTPGFYLGNFNYGPDLTATFNQSGNATVMSLGSDLDIGGQNTGIYNMSGGTLTLGGTINIAGADDAFNFSGGEIILSGNQVGFDAANDGFHVTGPNAANYIEVLNGNGTTSLTFMTFTQTIEVTRSGGTNVVSEEGPSTDSFEVVLLEAPDADVTVTLAPEDTNGDFFLNAEAPKDAVTLTFIPSNWDTPQTVTVTAVDDDEPEPTETLKVTVTGDSADSDFQVVLQTYVTIHDNDVFTGEVEVGPYVQFTGPYTAVVRWDTDNASNSVVQYGDSASLGSSASEPVSTTTHEVTIDNIEWKAKYFYRVNDGDGGYTDTYWFDNAINFTTVDCSAVVSPYAPDSLSAAYQTAADRIINQTGIKKGFCLVYGCGEGRLAFELAKRSELTIIGVDEDIDKIDIAAEKLMAAGVYGARVKLRHVSSLSSLDFTKYFFNLIVSDRMISDGNCPGSATEMFRVLRPSGGIAYLGQPAGAGGLTQGVLESWLDTGSLTYTTTNDSNGIWSKLVRGELAGASWWSHQYGTPYNSGNSFDTMQGVSGTGDLDLQWTGRPGADSALDRHVRMPAPVTAGGRLYHQGFNRLMTMDSYNGEMLWSLEIPHLKRVNMPRDASNACADDDAVYVAVKGDCWRLDGDTGLRTVTHKLNDVGHDWGCVFRYEDKLYGSATAAGASYTKYWELDTPAQGDYFYDSYPGRPPALTTVVFKVCSEYIFANDATGNRVWTYEDGVIINTTICMGGGRVYFVESRNYSLKGQPCGEPEALSEDWTYENGLWSGTELYLVALDADTGTKLWDKNIKTGPGGDPVVVDGQVVFNLLFAEAGGDEFLVLECSKNGAYYLYTYEVSDSTCNFRWTRNHGWGQNFKVLMKRPVIVGDIVYLHPYAYYLRNGNINRSDVPQSSCGIMSAIGNTLCGRFNSNPSGDIEMWDISSNKFSNWAPIRQGCWISVVSGGNMVLAPEGGGACSCQMYFQTSVGFVPAN